ncbi:MAG: UDP-phosphate galactose phosphotransferase [Candidatus Marinimicrobia bacterium]|nr:UDP-phosphate galactose phosphotransferase [Candidatus Neomarinimicrobiota bacterium]|tara:strand:- start:1681 stop:2241 length:561 start_codon:yes stop_codon:yes gene_type:complete
MRRLFDLLSVFFIFLFAFIPLIIISISVKLTSRGPILFWSKRVGRNEELFLMPKFRTMNIDAPNIATHLLKNPERFITPIGNFLRRSSLDELPQLYSVLLGHMSLVGPRPALFNQYDLIELRNIKGIDKLKPGITGWAQVNGRDELSIADKVKYEEEYLSKASFSFDIYIICLTIINAVRKEGITH